MTGVVNSISQNVFGRGVFPDQNGIVWDTPAPGSSSIGDILEDGLNMGSAAASIFSGDAKAGQLQMQAQEYNLQGQQELIKGTQQGNDIMRNMIQTIGAQRLAFSANGVDTSFGTPVSVANTTLDRGYQQLSIVNQNAGLNALAMRRQAASLNYDATQAQLQGEIKAAGTLGDAITKRINRG